jgi:hypothetical protein
MLAITERLLIDEGLDWVFCDTDSMAFAAPAGMDLAEFEKRVRNVCGRFEQLNPYEERGSILEFEDQNFAEDSSGNKCLEPLYCAAISAKRYAFFNLDSAGEPILWKASAHGLGHLPPPYDDDSNQGEREIGVRLWQEDVWKATIKSLRSRNPMEARLDWREELNRPSVGQYSAATPDRLDWFKDQGEDLSPASKAVQFLVGVLRKAAR